MTGREQLRTTALHLRDEYSQLLDAHHQAGANAVVDRLDEASRRFTARPEPPQLTFDFHPRRQEKR